MRQRNLSSARCIETGWIHSWKETRGRADESATGGETDGGSDGEKGDGSGGGGRKSGERARVTESIVEAY